MHEEIMYPVCPHRNVAAAFQRFLGPDSGGLERFFPDERARRTDGTLLIVRQRAARTTQAIGELRSALAVLTWIAGAAGKAVDREAPEQRQGGRIDDRPFGHAPLRFAPGPPAGLAARGVAASTANH